MGICCTTQGTQTGALWQSRRMGWEGDGREGWEGGDMGVPTADSCWCVTESHKILESNYPSIKKESGKNKKSLINIGTKILNNIMANEI